MFLRNEGTASAPRYVQLLGLCGGIGCGKTTLAKYLAEDRGFIRGSFAAKLKQVVADVYGLPDRYVWGSQERKATPLDGLQGRPRVLGPSGAPVTSRQLLEHVGTEGFRAIAPSTWSDYAMRWAAMQRGAVVFEDVRFPNEADAIWRAGGAVVKVAAPGAPEQRTGHASDEAWRELVPDVLVSVPYGDLDGLRAAAAGLACIRADSLPSFEQRQREQEERDADSRRAQLELEFT